MYVLSVKKLYPQRVFLPSCFRPQTIGMRIGTQAIITDIAEPLNQFFPIGNKSPAQQTVCLLFKTQMLFIVAHERGIQKYLPMCAVPRINGFKS